MTAKLKCILLNNFDVCCPTSMISFFKLILHLVSEVSKVSSQNSGQVAKGPYLLELCPLLSFRNLKCILLNNFYVCGPTSMKPISHLVSEVRKV